MFLTVGLVLTISEQLIEDILKEVGTMYVINLELGGEHWKLPHTDESAVEKTRDHNDKIFLPMKAGARTALESLKEASLPPGPQTLGSHNHT